MTRRQEVVGSILKERLGCLPALPLACAFAPANIALCKYWGKRDEELNLPLTSSLSVSLGEKGSTTTLSRSTGTKDMVISNGEVMPESSRFAGRVGEFLDLFRPSHDFYFHVDTHTNVPIAAGLASSASGFAALVMALDALFAWKLLPLELSILARLGSGSACRSIWQGFVEWEAGKREDGMDSFAHPLPDQWRDLRIGLLVVSGKEKALSSREAMARTRRTSPFYSLWPQKVEEDLTAIKSAIQARDIEGLGRAAESNAAAMHALMLSAWPSISYALPATLAHWETVWKLRQDGLPLYFTQDAGPNLKLLFLAKDLPDVLSRFERMEVIVPFGPMI